MQNRNMIIYHIDEYGSLDHYTINDISFPFLFPEDQALKNIDNITTCINCMEYGIINNIFLGPCANCAGNFDNKCGKGFISWGKELRTKSTDHINSVFDTYLKTTTELNYHGIKHTDALMFIIDRLVYCLIERHGSEKEYDIYKLARYLHNLRGNPRETLSRIYDANNLPTRELYNRNWSEFWRPWSSPDSLCSSSEEEENRRVPYQDIQFDDDISELSGNDFDFDDDISELTGNDFDFQTPSTFVSGVPSLPGAFGYGSLHNNENFWTPQEQEQIEQIIIKSCNNNYYD